MNANFIQILCVYAKKGRLCQTKSEALGIATEWFVLLQLTASLCVHIVIVTQ